MHLVDVPGAGHAAARRFCLDTIQAFYGFGYRADWHADLDGLLLPPDGNHYSRRHGGAFYVLHDGAGIVATAGIRHLAWKPNIVAMFPGRYPDPMAVATLCRVYIRADRRGGGIGRALAALCEREAARLGYGTMYLHASSDTPPTLAFWHAVDYRRFGMCDSSTHFDKALAPGLI